MKSIKGIIFGLGLFTLAGILHGAQLLSTLDPIQPAVADSIVQITAEAPCRMRRAMSLS